MSLTFTDLSYSVQCGCSLLRHKWSTHHLLQGGAATKGTCEQSEAVNERGEELVRKRCQNASRKRADEVTDNVGDTHRLRVFNLNPARE